MYFGQEACAETRVVGCLMLQNTGCAAGGLEDRAVNLELTLNLRSRFTAELQKA